MILDDIRGLKILVTGASTGIGAAASIAFGEHGASVAVHYNLSRAEAEAVAAEIGRGPGKAVTVAGDLRDPALAAAMVDKAAAALGGIDVLVNNAGALVRLMKFQDYEDAVFDEVFSLNVRSVLAVTRAAFPYLKASGRGSVINTGSIAGRNGGQPGSGIYAAAKAAVHSLTKGMANEFAPDDVRVNTVAPGVILTPFHVHNNKERLEGVRQTIPMRRLGTVEDCIGSFLFLASPAMSGYITGQTIDINGGRLFPG